MPSATASMVFFYVYVLEMSDGDKYIGYTTDLPRRIKEHRNGLSFATKPRLPMKLIYFEACKNQEDAMRREKYFKSTRGRRFLAKRLKVYFMSKL